MKKECPHCKDVIEYDKFQKFSSHQTFCHKNPKRQETITKLQNKLKGKLIVNRIKYKINCKNCNKEFEIEITESNFKKGKYKKCCSSYCSHSYSSGHNNYESIKKTICKECGKDIIIKNNASARNVLCDSCRKNRKYINDKKNKGQNKIIIKELINGEIKYKILCKLCGQEKCLNPDICKKFRLFPALIKYFGFNGNVIGTLDLYKEYEKIKLNLYNDYYENLLSIPDLIEKYNYKSKNERNFSKIMESLDIERRNFSDSSKLTYLNGKNKPLINPKYKNGWHTTWNGKNVFYRSSYELHYCNILDEDKIDYEMEKIRLVYWDSQKLKFRITIPDFYLKDSNTIVEIKGNYTFDEQNIKDRIKSYVEHGYKYKIILEGKDIKI